MGSFFSHDSFIRQPRFRKYGINRCTILKLILFFVVIIVGLSAASGLIFMCSNFFVFFPAVNPLVYHRLNEVRPKKQDRLFQKRATMPARQYIYECVWVVCTSRPRQKKIAVNDKCDRWSPVSVRRNQFFFVHCERMLLYALLRRVCVYKYIGMCTLAPSTYSHISNMKQHFS